MDRGGVGDKRGSKEMDRCPLTVEGSMLNGGDEQVSDDEDETKRMQVCVGTIVINMHPGKRP
jgi:hypothetical protein